MNRKDFDDIVNFRTVSFFPINEAKSFNIEFDSVEKQLKIGQVIEAYVTLGVRIEKYPDQTVPDYVFEQEAKDILYANIMDAFAPKLSTEYIFEMANDISLEHIWVNPNEIMGVLYKLCRDAGIKVVNE